MTGQIQLFIGQKQVGDGWQLAECFDLGDVIGVDGELRRTKTGELSIFVEQLTMLTKSLAAPPEKHHGLTDPELRQRMRYLDLTYGDGVMPRFLNRTKIVRSIRDTLHARGFVEVEGPTLHSIAGGAAARPFKTHHNALDIDLFLRIALELHLKRLLVGGIERVYELGRVYPQRRHQPEAQSRIHDARGLPGLRRLPLDDGPDRGLHRRGDSGDGPTVRACHGARRRSISRRRSPAKRTTNCSQSTPASIPPTRPPSPSWPSRSASKRPASIPT